MTVLALANLGTHDLQDPNGRFPNPSQAKFLLENPDLGKEYSLPIIVPFLRAIKEKTRQVPTLLLFVTWQKNVSDAIHLKDTEPLGQLVKSWLETGDKSDYQDLAKKVILSPPAQSEAHNYDLMLEWFENILPGCIKKAIGTSTISLSNPPRLHISVTAGTPAMNTALMFKAFGLPVGRVENVWHISEGSPKPSPLRIGHVLAGEPLRSTFRAHLERHDYDAAAELAQYVAPPWVLMLVRALADIRCSDFNGVKQYLHPKKRWDFFLSWAELLNAGRREMDSAVNRKVLINNGVKAIHAYQISEIRVHFKRGDYPEALTALYRLQESLVRIAFEQITSVPGLISQKQESYEEWKRKLEAFLTGRGLKWDFNLTCTREVQGKVVQLAEPQYEISRWLDRLYTENIGPRNLASLRNKCRVAHGFCAVTDRAIKDAGWPGGPNEIIEEANNVAQTVLGSFSEPPYAGFHEKILNGLDR